MHNSIKSKESATTKRRVARCLIQLALVLVIIAAVHWWRSNPLVSGEAPPLAGDLVGTGHQVNLDDFKGHPTLVYFWATWCPMCRFSEDTINALAKNYQVVTVAIQSGSPTEIKAYLHQSSLTLAVISDPNGALASRWGVSGVPAGFILDSDGQIRFATIGYTTGIGLRARLWAAERMN